VSNNNDETADSPFDFAQGRLFGDDNQNCNDKNNGNGKSVRTTATTKADPPPAAKDDN
jgi:hypothetical protein